MNALFGQSNIVKFDLVLEAAEIICILGVAVYVKMRMMPSCSAYWQDLEAHPASRIDIIVNGDTSGKIFVPNLT